ncbi:sulfatase-like hydrolase/transferase [Halapricum sp. CBA1109]|uniref:sulfatase-like hydrolase/transferase n=1 Tax=Halapricum sp. CBA1109 TaxID=2668068 RepID=UPI0012F8266C|nr:sulfatase-like hydrolase/transferase [Halapricum sp. CBA1109]MUV88724.1 sulfatase-like hydrolase/transferase [Halapricum sp. CBA1109]
MDDIIFVTADSVRYDYIDAMEYLSSFDVLEGVTAAHYTRPSLASIHASTFSSVLTGHVEQPTLAQSLSEAGYTTLGLSPNPNTDAAFGFADGFDRYDSFIEPGNRGSSLRQYLAKFDLLRRVYYKFYPPHAKSEDRPTDREVVEQAIEWFNEAESPRFLWIHLMETHRPYGAGDDAISKELDQKAFFKPTKLTDAEREEIETKYRDSLARADENVRYLREQVDSDPALVFTADHGEGFGDEGYYFHQPQLRRVDDCLIDVPVIFDGIDVEEGPLSLLDLTPTMAAHGGGTVEDRWLGNNLLEETTDTAVTVAPWHEQATVAWQDFENKLISHDADVTFEGSDTSTDAADEEEVPEDLKETMRDLGYLK